MAKFQVTVTDISREKGVTLIKSLRLIGDLGLKDAKELAEFLGSTKPCILVAGIDRLAIGRLKRQVEIRRRRSVGAGEDLVEREPAFALS